MRELPLSSSSVVELLPLAVVELHLNAKPIKKRKSANRLKGNGVSGKDLNVSRKPKGKPANRRPSRRIASKSLHTKNRFSILRPVAVVEAYSINLPPSSSSVVKLYLLVAVELHPLVAVELHSLVTVELHPRVAVKLHLLVAVEAYDSHPPRHSSSIVKLHSLVSLL